MQSETIIEVKGLTKEFGQLKAVNDIFFTVNKGEIFAFLGPNGAGKSTAIKMLITLLKPTSGGGTVNGHDFVLNPSDVRRAIGYVPQLISVDGTLTANENLTLMARLYDVPAKDLKSRVGEILSFFKLEQHADSLVRTFSGGMIRRLEIGQAILHRPQVLFLDEPTAGLDPVAKQAVWQHLMELRDLYGMTIFFSTHDMAEADEVSDRVAIMHNGRIVVIGTVAKLKQKTGREKSTLEDAFIFFTGDKLEEISSFRDIKRARQNIGRLG